MKDDTPSKWQPKESGRSHTYIRQYRLQAKKTTRDKDEHYIMIKEMFHQEDITFINIFAPDIGAPNYIKQLLTDLKGEINSNSKWGPQHPTYINE